MLDLDARVHFQEVEALPCQVDQELDRAQAAVMDVLGEADGGRVQVAAHGVGQIRCGCLFDQFLIAALDRTIAVADVDHALAVAQNLHFDMAPLGDEALHVNATVAKSCKGFGTREIEERRQIFRRVGTLQATTTTTTHSLNENGVANLLGHRERGR